MSRKSGRRGRRLTEEERALWKGATRSIVPLKRPATDEEPEMPDIEPALVGHRTKPHGRLHAPPSKALPLTPLDRRTKRRVARGKDEIGARIDLHGMTQARAYTALLHFLARAQADGAKIALIITGRGKRIGDDGARERGVLKRQVPLWLSLPEFHAYVVGFDDASVGHGGQGALYVRMRRIKE